MTSFDEFLTALTDELRHLREQPDLLRVTHVRDAAKARHQISIGIGQQVMDDRPATATAFPVALNNKTIWDGIFTHRPSSVAVLVGKAPASLLSMWHRNIGAPTGPLGLSGLDLCVEDASPDSCFGLLTFLAAMGGVPRDAVPARWIAYVDAWERGFASHGIPPIEYGVLHNALVHSLVDTDLRGAWIDGLALLVECLLHDADPAAIDLDTDGTLVARAAAALRFEQATYEQCRDVMTRLQLELPLAVQADRRLLVDAIFAEERLLMGVQKTHFRADKEHSFLGRGYTVNVIYRPVALGDGNDITVSLDPASGLSLRSLWQALEREEERRWDGQRPTEKPRMDLSGYRGGRGPDGGNAPEQPWYHDPDFTLIAAPKSLLDGSLASRLSWADVQALIWAEYSPFARIRVSPAKLDSDPNQTGTEVTMAGLEACPDSVLKNGVRTRRLRIGQWYRPDNSVPPLQWSPTLGRMLAACLQQAPSSSPIGFDALQAAPTHSHVELDSALAVICEHGVYLLQHHLASNISIGEMQTSFEACAGAMDWIDRHRQEVSDLLRTVLHHMSGQRTAKLNRDLKIYNRICALQLDILRLRHALESGTLAPISQQFRDAILRGWGVNGQLDALHRDLDEAKIILTAHGELVTNRRIALLTYFGFPLAVAGSFTGLMFAAGQEPLSVNWPQVLTFTVIVVLGCMLILFASWFGDRKARLNFRDTGQT